jgi:hypothetical protein
LKAFAGVIFFMPMPVLFFGGIKNIEYPQNYCILYEGDQADARIAVWYCYSYLKLSVVEENYIWIKVQVVNLQV